MTSFVRNNFGRVGVYLVIALVSVVLETGIAFILAALAGSVTGTNDYSPVSLTVFGILYLIPLGGV